MSDILDAFVEPGIEKQTGSFNFTKSNIIEFARKYDPQRFHLDEELAKETVFGKLCASGWHTISVWMKLQREFSAKRTDEFRKLGQEVPEFGPSPGMQNIRWPAPVFPGDTISYFTKVEGYRASNSRPGWFIASQSGGGRNQSGALVVSFESAVFIASAS